MNTSTTQDKLLDNIPSRQLRKQAKDSTARFRSDEIIRELKALGAVKYNLMLPETHSLPYIIHSDERLKGAVYGKYKSGRGALFATDQRILFVNKKPMFVQCDEITFMVIGGVSYTRIGPIGTVTLHTRLGDYSLRTFNHALASSFVAYIESRCLNDKSKGGNHDYVTQERALQAH